MRPLYFNSFFVFNGNFNGEILDIMSESDLNMIDLVLTHLNQPWGPPWTLATIYVIFRHDIQNWAISPTSTWTKSSHCICLFCPFLFLFVMHSNLFFIILPNFSNIRIFLSLSFTLEVIQNNWVENKFQEHMLWKFGGKLCQQYLL